MHTRRMTRLTPICSHWSDAHNEAFKGCQNLSAWLENNCTSSRAHSAAGWLVRTATFIHGLSHWFRQDKNYTSSSQPG